MSSIFRGRGELFEHFSHVIEDTYDQLVQEQKLEYGQNMLKTFLLESNISPENL